MNMQVCVYCKKEREREKERERKKEKEKERRENERKRERERKRKREIFINLIPYFWNIEQLASDLKDFSQHAGRKGRTIDE